MHSIRSVTTFFSIVVFCLSANLSYGGAEEPPSAQEHSFGKNELDDEVRLEHKVSLDNTVSDGPVEEMSQEEVRSLEIELKRIERTHNERLRKTPSAEVFVRMYQAYATAFAHWVEKQKKMKKKQEKKEREKEPAAVSKGIIEETRELFGRKR